MQVVHDCNVCILKYDTDIIIIHVIKLDKVNTMSILLNISILNTYILDLTYLTLVGLNVAY